MAVNRGRQGHRRLYLLFIWQPLGLLGACLFIPPIPRSKYGEPDQEFTASTGFLFLNNSALLPRNILEEKFYEFLSDRPIGSPSQKGRSARYSYRPPVFWDLSFWERVTFSRDARVKSFAVSLLKFSPQGIPSTSGQMTLLTGGKRSLISLSAYIRRLAPARLSGLTRPMLSGQSSAGTLPWYISHASLQWDLQGEKLELPAAVPLRVSAGTG